MVNPERLVTKTDDDQIDGDDKAGWGRLPPVDREEEEDGPPSDYRPFRDDPE